MKRSTKFSEREGELPNPQPRFICHSGGGGWSCNIN